MACSTDWSKVEEVGIIHGKLLLRRGLLLNLLCKKSFLLSNLHPFVLVSSEDGKAFEE